MGIRAVLPLGSPQRGLSNVSSGSALTVRHCVSDGHENPGKGDGQRNHHGENAIAHTTKVASYSHETRRHIVSTMTELDNVCYARASGAHGSKPFRLLI